VLRAHVTLLGIIRLLTFDGLTPVKRRPLLRLALLGA